MLNNEDILNKSEEEILEARRIGFRRTRLLLMAGILGTAIGMLSSRCATEKEEEVPENVEYTSAVKVETVEGVKYYAPAGFNLTFDKNGNPYCYRYINNELSNTKSH